MRESEKKRRTSAVKEAIKAHLAEIKASTNAHIEDNACDDLLKEEKVAEYVEMEDADGFCGDKVACKDVDARCMSAIVKAAKEEAKKNNSMKTWTEEYRANAEKGSFFDEAIKSTLK